MAVTPVLMVGSGTGAQRGEWSEGRDLPVRSASLRTAGSTPPPLNMQIGILSPVRPYSEKSSPPIGGSSFKTLAAPSHAREAVASFAANSGSLEVAGVDSSARVTS